jgi:uncharacterized membrane protein
MTERIEDGRSSSVMAKFRKWLLAGLLVLVPLIITLWVLNWVIGTLDQTLRILPVAWHPDHLLGFHIPGLGVIFAVGVVLAIGAMASNIIGNRLLAWGNALMQRIPVVRGIYSGVKQVSDTLFSEKGNAFRQAVLVQWPRPGMWTIGFVTGTPGGELVHHLQGDYLSVYVPTTPNPTGGYFVMLKASDCVVLDMSVDAALTYVISMGVIAPGTKTPAESDDKPA